MKYIYKINEKYFNNEDKAINYCDIFHINKKDIEKIELEKKEYTNDDFDKKVIIGYEFYLDYIDEYAKENNIELFKFNEKLDNDLRKEGLYFQLEEPNILNIIIILDDVEKQDKAVDIVFEGLNEIKKLYKINSNIEHLKKVILPYIEI